MEGTYDVMLGSEKMGTVTVSRQGLYWHFFCSCVLSGEVMYDLVVRLDGRQEKLGLLSPAAGKFELRTKIAAKKLGEGSPVFILRARHSAPDGLFVPVRPEEPFAYLSRLQSAYLRMQEQQIGIVLPDEN